MRTPVRAHTRRANLKQDPYFERAKMIARNKTMKVKELQDPKYQLIQQDSDVQSIKDYYGKKADGFDYFLVEVKDGDYEEVWGGTGSVPYDDDYMERIA
jgi:hypothetical protein